MDWRFGAGIVGKCSQSKIIREDWAEKDGACEESD